MKDNFFVVIPVCNEGKNIVKVIESVKKITKNIIVVDDGSNDQTFSLVKKTKVLVLKHSVNLGKGAALKTGCQAAFKLGADFVVIMDGDGQHDANDLPLFLEAMNKTDNDLVLGVREMSFGVPLERFIGIKIASFLINLLFGIYIVDPISGFRAFNKKFFKKVGWESYGYEVETEMLIKAAINKLKIKEIMIKTIYLDKYKGVTVLDSFKVFLNLIKWRFL